MDTLQKRLQLTDGCRLAVDQLLGEGGDRIPARITVQLFQFPDPGFGMILDQQIPTGFAPSDFSCAPFRL